VKLYAFCRSSPSRVTDSRALHGGARKAVVLSAAAFGAWHLSYYPRFFVASTSYAFYIFGIGLILGAARIRIDAIWPLVLIHAANDVPSFLFPFGTGISRPMPTGIYRWISAVPYVVVGIVYALVLTRRSRTAPAPSTDQATRTTSTTAVG